MKFQDLSKQKKKTWSIKFVKSYIFPLSFETNTLNRNIKEKNKKKKSVINTSAKVLRDFDALKIETKLRCSYFFKTHHRGIIGTNIAHSAISLVYPKVTLDGENRCICKYTRDFDKSIQTVKKIK